MPRCGAAWKKPVGEISDRAKRYRANHPDCKPKGKFCETCGSRKNLLIGHRDGNESNGRPYNLGTFCKSCNTADGKAMAKAGKGVRTRQYNPKRNYIKTSRRKNAGAGNLAQYVQAAVDHTRGAHDAGGKVIHETPKAKRREYAREIAFRKGYGRNPRKKNPEQESAADAGYRKFHGRGPDLTYTLKPVEIDPYGKHPELFQCGWLIRFIVGEGIKLSGEYGDDAEGIADNCWSRELNFVPSVEKYHDWMEELDSENKEEIQAVRAWLRQIHAPDVAGVPDFGKSRSAPLASRQLYIVGGNQHIDDSLLVKLGSDPEKDICDLGFVYLIEYFTQKRFDQFMPVNYWHHFGELTGVQPRLIYHRIPKVLQLVGGEYVVKSNGIDN